MEAHMQTLAGVGHTQRWLPRPAGAVTLPSAGSSSSPATDESGCLRLRPGSVIPGTRVCVDGWLGEGATSVVYRGLHIDLGRPLAIKVLRQTGSPEATCERFLAEARLTSKLDSEFVVEVVDFGHLPDGRLYYAMELLDGHPLDEILRRRSLPVAQVVALLRMACKGLQTVHEHGVVHRDIKPGNMMVISKRKRERLVIVDFGIATPAGEAPLEVRGTPQTMAPEQICGGVVDARTDVYALGCSAFHMLTGTPFGHGENVSAILALHLEPTRPRIGPMQGVPKPLADVIHRCLELCPEDRFESARELEAALCEAQIAAGLVDAGEHLEPPDVEPQRRARIVTGLSSPKRRVSARSTLAALLCSVVLLLVGGGWARSRMVAAEIDATRVEELVAAARDAADRSYFVYPSPREEVRTAYQHVVELEHWDGPAAALADDQAAALRAELGQALLTLGDRSWDEPEAQGYARDYYAQALIFDPSLARARDRVGMTFGELAELRNKAVTDSFSVAELEVASALVLDGGAPVLMPAVAASGPRSRDPRPRTLDGAKAMPTPSKQGTANEASADVPRDPVRARSLVRSAKRAQRAGRSAEARELYQRALLLDDRSAEAYAGLADACFDDGDHQLGLRYAKLAVRRAPSVARYRLQLGDAYYRVARHDDAIAEYRKAAALGSEQARRRLEQLDRG